MRLTVQQAASFLDVPEREIYLWLDEGEIPFSREQGRIRFNQTELLEWAMARGVRPSHPFQADGEIQAPGLADALSLGGVHEGLAATDRAAAIRAAVERLPLRPGDDPGTLLDVILPPHPPLSPPAR